MASTLESGPAGKSTSKSGALPDAKLAECERFIEAQLGATRGQVKGVEIATATLKLFVGVLAYLSLVVVVDHWLLPGGLGFWTRSLALLTLLGGGGWYLATRVLPLFRKRVNPVYAAYSIEKTQPTLKNSVINFLLLRRERERVSDPIFVAIEQRAASDLQRVPVDGTVDRSGLIRLGYVLVGLVTLVCAYWLLSPKDPWRTFRRVATPWADVAPATRVTIDLVEPGSTRVFQGERVRVTARVRGVRKGEEVTLFWSTADGQNVDQPIAMQPSTEGYTSYFEAEVPGGSGTLQQNTEYYLRAGDAESPRFRLEVVTAPAILVERVEYAYPAYADVQNRVVERQGDLQGIDGTTVTITARANVPIKSAHIDFDADGGRDLPLALSGQVATGSFVLSLNKQGEPQNKNYQVRFLDATGHENPHPVRHTIEVLPDQPPEIEFTEPGQDEVELALNGALPLALRARDRDFKLRRVTIFVEKKGGTKLRSEVLLDEPRGGQFDGSLVFDASSLEPGAVAAGDTIEYWAEARDNRQPVANEAHTVKHRIRLISPVDEAERQRQIAEAEKKAKEAAAREAEQTVAGDDRTGEDEQTPAGEESEVASSTPPDGAEAAKPSTERKDPEREAAEAMEDILAYRDEQSGEQPADDAPPREDQANQPNDQAPDSAEQPQSGDNQPGADQQSGEQGSGDQADSKQKPVDADHSGDDSSKPQDAASKPKPPKSDKPESGSQSGEPQQGDPQEGEEQGSGQSGDKGDESQQSGGESGGESGEQSGEQSGNQSGNQSGEQSGEQSGSQQQGSSGQGKPKPQSGSEGSSGEQSSSAESSSGSGGKPRTGQKPGGSGEGSAEPDSATPDSGATEKPTRTKPGARKPGAKQPKPPSADSGEAGDEEGASADGAAQPGAKPKPKPGSKPTKPDTKPTTGDKPQPGDQPSEDGSAESGAEPGAQQQPGQDPSADSSQEGAGRQGDSAGQSSERQPSTNATEGGSPQQGGKPPAGRKPKKPQQASPQEEGGESPNEAAAEATKPSGGKPKAEKPKPEAGEGESAASSKPQSQDNPGEQGSGAGAGDRSAPPAGEERDKPPSEEEERHDQEATGGDQNNSQGESGAGQQPENHKPSGRMDQQQGTKQKNQQSDSQTDPSNDDVGDNASSPKPHESDSQGAESGDRQGGGQQGGGQKAKKPGTGSAGENTASDQGGGEAEGAGDGNASDQAGNKTEGKQPQQGEGQKTDGAGSSGESSQPQGESGSPSSSGQSGGGSAGRKPPQSTDKPRKPSSPQGQKPAGGSGEQPNKPSQPEAGERGETPQQDQQDSSSGGDVGGTNGAQGAGVNQGDGRPPAPGQSGAAPAQEAMGGEEANAEYARKQTDLVIDSLRDQLADNNVDPELLKKLGWSREDVEKFVRRWEALRKAAGQEGPEGDKAREQYERVISDLNLKRRGVSIRQTAKPDQVNRLRESRGTKPPAEYADQFRAYTEGASKAAAPKGK